MDPRTISFIRALVDYAKQNGASSAHIFERAEACGVLPVLMHALDVHGISAENIGMTEDAVRKELMQFKMQQTARIMLWHQTAKAVLSKLKPQVIVLKGVPLGERLAGNALWRSTTDLDLWIPEQDCDDAVDRLSQIGYRIAEEPRRWATNQIMLVHDVLVPVELHWALAPKPWRTPAFDEAFERSGLVCLRGLEMRVLRDSDLAVHLLLHAHQHYFALKTLLDLCMACEALERSEFELRRLGMENINGIARMLCDSFYRNKSDTFLESWIKRASCSWYRSVFLSEYRSELVFGRDSKVVAGFGVILRAVSMGLLDGYCYPFEAFLRVIFLGPHRIGALNHKFLYQFIEK